MAMSFAMLTTRARPTAAAWRDSALYVALAMALFAMLFGTRARSAAEHNRGLVLAMAFESVFKLAAMLALGAFVWFGLESTCRAGVHGRRRRRRRFRAAGAARRVRRCSSCRTSSTSAWSNAATKRDVRTARWQFPLYLVLIALPVLPLARAGRGTAGGSVPSDLYVLALPLSQGHDGLALFAFLGGLSAATGMVVVSTLTLSLMIGNHWFAPGLLRGAWSRTDGGDLRGTCCAAARRHRRDHVAGVGYSRCRRQRGAGRRRRGVVLGAGDAGAGAAFAVWRPQTPPRAAVVGDRRGVRAWAGCMLLPMGCVQRDRAGLVLHGPFGSRGCRPTACSA
jgi:hypothetical protein